MSDSDREKVGLNELRNSGKKWRRMLKIRWLPLTSGSKVLEVLRMIGNIYIKSGNVEFSTNNFLTDYILISRYLQKLYIDLVEFQIMVLGDSCTGKTCLLVRYKDGAFLNNNFISTVGIDYRNKVIELDGKKIKLQVGNRWGKYDWFIKFSTPIFLSFFFWIIFSFQIWDTAGQERFRSVTAAYYRDADALLLVFDVSNRTSFENIRVIIFSSHQTVGSAKTLNPANHTTSLELPFSTVSLLTAQVIKHTEDFAPSKLGTILELCK